MHLLNRIPDYCSRGYVEINLDAVESNMVKLHKLLKPETKMIGVIKTNGYGHGSAPIGEILEPLDFMWGFAVATAEEARELRERGVKKPLLLLGYSFPYSYEMCAILEIRPAVFRRDMVDDLQQAAVKAGRNIKVHIKVDTGMRRIGITPDEDGLAFVEYVCAQPNLEVEGIFTHFAKADETDKTDTFKQLHRFLAFTQMIEERLGLKIPYKHCSNSAGIIDIQDANLNIVRAGIVLYGLQPSEEVNIASVGLTPAMSWYSRVVYIKTLKKGESVSYGGTFTASEDMKIATVCMGYGDGYPRSLSGKGYILLHGRKAPILGRICMDQFMVDVSDIEEAQIGDRAVLLGADGEEHITAEELGKLSARFNYELVCDVSPRVPRIYTYRNNYYSE